MLDRIIYDPTRFDNQPIIQGTGMSVQAVLELLLQEMSVADTAVNHPQLTHEDILVAIHFAIQTISQQKPSISHVVSKPKGLQNRLLQIGQQCSALPLLDSRSPEEILGYNDIGVPV